MCALKESTAVTDGWETAWDTWDVPREEAEIHLDKEKLSSHLKAKMLERRCAGILDSLAKEEISVMKRHDPNDEKYLELLCATIVTIQTYVNGDTILDDILYVGMLWQQYSNACNTCTTIRLAENVVLLCRNMA
jgi:hypothetical protein